MRGKKNPKCRTRGPSRNQLATRERMLPQARERDWLGGSWLRPRLAGLNRIPSCERQIGQCCKDLRAGRNVCRASLRQRALGGGYIQEVTQSVVVRFERRTVRLAGGFEQSDGC